MKNKKSLSSLLLIFFMIFGLVSPVKAEEPIKLWINGGYVETDVPPIAENNRTLVPIRVISENLGHEVYWDQETQTVEIVLTDYASMGLFLGKTEYYIGDEKHISDVAPKVVNERTLVPIRLIAETFGLNVDWDKANKTVVIGDGYVASTPTETKVNKNTFTQATVTRVIDGDTIEVSINGQGYKVRLIGVNTPETKHPTKGVEYFGKEASAYTTQQLTGKTVYLQKDVSETDKYGRLLRYVWLGRPTSNNPTNDEIGKKMFNSRLVENGYAYASAYVPDVRYQEYFRTREEIARNNGYGLWGAGASNTSSGGSSTSGGSSSSSSGSGSGGWKETKDPAAGHSRGKIIGNKNSGIYHVPGGASYNKVSAKNAVYFNTEAEARAAGYRRAKR